MSARRRRDSWPFRLAYLLIALAVPCQQSHAQLTTGDVEGFIYDRDGHPRTGFPLSIRGALGFQTTVITNAWGEFTLSLPYGEYLVSSDTDAPGVALPVGALRTTRIDLVIEASGVLHKTVDARSPGVWAESAQATTFPGTSALPGLLLNRESASITEPLDFTGLHDNRLGVLSQRGYSWSDTQYKLLGMDATDSYQPGHPVIAPGLDALDEVVVGSAFAQTAWSGFGTEASIFTAQPGAAWHSALATANTAGFLSASNLPPIDQRGIVRQADRFRWFTHDSARAGGPLGRWADLFVSGASQWSSQNVPLAVTANNQRSRLLWGDARGRIRAGAKDQIDALYSGSRININDWGEPSAIESLVGRRMSPAFNLPGGFAGQSEVDHFDFLQGGWIHRFAEGSVLGLLQLRYGYSTAHLDADPRTGPLGNSTIDLATGTITGGPPMFTRAVRSRQGISGAWQPSIVETAGLRHQILVGAGWKTSSPLNRITIPTNVNLITVDGVPSEVVEFNTPADSRSIIRSFESYVRDQLRLAAGLSLDLGVLADLSRGSIPLTGNAQFVNSQPEKAHRDLIVWNSLSPRVSLAWQVPHMRRLVLRGTYFRLKSPLAGRYLDFGNPNSLNGSVYRWADRNSDFQFQPSEQGALLARFGGAYSSISPSLQRPYADEFNLGAEFAVAPGTFAAMHLFRRDDKHRIAAIDTGVPASAFTPVAIVDPGPDGITGTFDDQALVAYNQNPATLGRDQYLLTNPPGLRAQSTGFVAETGGQWRNLSLHLSFLAEKTYGPTNPGNAVFENDPGVVGALFLDPNTTAYAPDRSFMDRAYVGKMQGSYKTPAALGGLEIGSTFVYMDGLLFRRQLLVAGFAQGPFLLPAWDNRAQYAADWNLRILRAFRLPRGKIEVAGDIFNVLNAGRKIQESDVSGPSFNLRLPTAIQEPRQVRLLLRYEF